LNQDENEGMKNIIENKLDNLRNEWIYGKGMRENRGVE
jgi:hypothetical protein